MAQGFNIEQSEGRMLDFVESRLSERWANDPDMLRNNRACAPYVDFPSAKAHCFFNPEDGFAQSIGGPPPVPFEGAESLGQFVFSAVARTGTYRYQNETHVRTWNMCGRTTSPPIPAHWQQSFIADEFSDWTPVCDYGALGEAVFDAMDIPAPTFPQTLVNGTHLCGDGDTVGNYASLGPYLDRGRALYGCLFMTSFRFKGNVNTGIGLRGFGGTKGIALLAGGWVIETWEIYKEGPHCYLRRFNVDVPRLISTEVFRGKELIRDAAGRVVHPQPTSNLTEVVLEAAPNTAKFLFITP